LRFSWPTVDAALLTALLELSPVWQGPVAIGYPVLIVVSGLWFRVGVVWFTAALAAAAYGWLCLAHYFRAGTLDVAHHHLIFLVGLLVLAYATAAQVRRVRALSYYYQHRPLP